jgi:hypothetical protein
MTLPKWATTVTPLSKTLAMVIFVTFPIIAFFLGVKYEKLNYQTKKELNQANTKTIDNSGSERNRLIQVGIHPDPVSIKILNLNALWNEDNFSFHAIKAYLTPDIADLGSSRNNNSIKNKSFFIVQTEVRNISTKTNGRMQVQADNYFRIRKDGKDMTPLTGNVIFLNSQEDGTLYAVFPVDIQETTFKLLLGSIARPRVMDLDFKSNETLQLIGVFLFKDGFALKYEQ